MMDPFEFDWIAMWDKSDIRIPFSDLYVSESYFSQSDDRQGFIDFRKYDFPAQSDTVFIDGREVIKDTRNRKWASLPSSISKVAMGFFPEGHGFDKWPHIRLKCSPAKILQGHNVFGSEDIKPGTLQMISFVNQAFPKIYEHLDLQAAEFYNVDCTYSARVKSEYYRDAIFRLFKNIPNRNRKIIEREGYLLLNATSKYQSQKIYEKAQELLDDLKECKKLKQQERVEVLSNPKLMDFTLDLMRFEAMTGRRGMENLGLPKNIWEFFKFSDWYEKAYKEPICRHIWRSCFDPLFNELRGHTMKKVDDSNIKTKIFAKLVKVKEDGKVCQRKANAVWRTYRAIKTEGYATLAKERNTTFKRNVRHLVNDVGLSRAFLKSLDPNRPHENVVPIVSLINIDFSNQKPSWYQEPVAGYDDVRRHLRLVS